MNVEIKSHFFKVSENQLNEFKREQEEFHFSGKSQIVKRYLTCETCGATEETENCSRTIYTKLEVSDENK